MLKEYKVGFEEYSKFSEEEHAKMIKEEECLSNFDAQLVLKYKILSLNTTMENKSIIYRRYEELLVLDTSNDEYPKLKHWLRWATNLSYDTIKETVVDNLTQFIKFASYKMDKELYGMKKIKEQILMFLSSKISNPNMRKSNLGLVGLPGVGKTSIARMIASLMDIGFEQISFGGVDKAEFLKGHDYTYIGSQPGEIVKCLSRMKHKNGIIFLDELDKASDNPEISAALLHLVDQSQNFDFKDKFLGEITIDLSHIWYVGSMNKIPKDDALVDRWWIIEVEGYNLSDKIEITEKYLLPKALQNTKLSRDSIVFGENSTSYFINKVSSEMDKGVRTIQKYIFDLVNKISFLVTHQNSEGKLPYNISFNTEKKLVYPVTLTPNLIDIVIERKKESNFLHMMYL